MRRARPSISWIARPKGNGPSAIGILSMLCSLSPARSVVSSRFNIALRSIVGGLLLVASVTKAASVFPTRPPVLAATSGLWDTNLFYPLVGAQFALGAWLLAAGFNPPFLRTATGLCFLVFSAISASSAMQGISSCGCFGAVAINPWITASVDIALAIALLASRVAVPLDEQTSLCRFIKRPALVSFCMYAVIWYASWHVATAAQPRAVDIANANIIAEPRQLLGHEFPLIHSTDIGPRLTHGHWFVVLVRRSCKKCNEIIHRWQRSSRVDARRLVFIDIDQTRGLDRPRSGVWGALIDGSRWEAETPIAVELVDGTVVKYFINGEPGDG